LAELYAEHAVLCHPLSPAALEGRQAIRESEQALFDAFSKIEVNLRTVLTGDQGCVAELVIRATNSGPLDLGGEERVAATGRRIELPSVWVLDIGPDGLIVEERDYFDTAAFMSQLGL
jgi:predicted ester cyclase